MANDENHFRIHRGRVRDHAGGRTTRAVRPRPKTFLAEVHQAIRRAGGDPFRLGADVEVGIVGSKSRLLQVLTGKNSVISVPTQELKWRT